MERYDPVNMPYTKAMIADKLGGYVKYEDHESEINSLKEQLEKERERYKNLEKGFINYAPIEIVRKYLKTK